MLYSVGDLRAQGLLQKKHVLHLALTCFAGIVCVLTLYHGAAVALAHPFAANATFPAVLSLCAFLLLVVNALSVGMLSETSGCEEMRALRYLPVTVADFVRIRVLVGRRETSRHELRYLPHSCVLGSEHPAPGDGAIWSH